MGKHGRQRQSDFCKTWPTCICGRYWRHYQQTEIDPDAFENEKIVIKAMLSCVGHRCPDAAFRLKALSQLTKPIFNEDEAPNGGQSKGEANE